MAFMSLLREKPLVGLLHISREDTKNQEDVTRKWYAEAPLSPLNFFLAAGSASLLRRCYFGSTGLRTRSDWRSSCTESLGNAKPCVSAPRLSEIIFWSCPSSPGHLCLWLCCSRQSCPVGSCRPTFEGCTTSGPTAHTTSASTSPEMELKCHFQASPRWARTLRSDHTGTGTRSYPCR